MTTIERMTTAQLVAEHNRLNPEHPVKRFSDRTTGVKRVYALLGKTLSAPATAQSKLEAPSKPVEAPKPAPAPSKAARKPSTPRTGAKLYKGKGQMKPPAEGSKRAEFFAALSKGVDYAMAQKKWGWSPTDVRDVVGQLSRKMGHTIERTAEGVYRLK